MTKIQCDLSGVSILDTRFVIKVMGAITQAEGAVDTDSLLKVISLSSYFKRQLKDDLAAYHERISGSDHDGEFVERGFQADLAVLHVFFQVMEEEKKYVEPVGLSSVDQMLWDRAAEFSRKVQQWSNKGGTAEDHGLPPILICTSCRTFFAHSKKGVQSGIMDCRKCETKTNHVRLEGRYAAGVDQP